MSTAESVADATPPRLLSDAIQIPFPPGFVSIGSWVVGRHRASRCYGSHLFVASTAIGELARTRPEEFIVLAHRVIELDYRPYGYKIARALELENKTYQVDNMIFVISVLVAAMLEGAKTHDELNTYWLRYAH